MSTRIPLIRFHLSETGEVNTEYMPMDPIDTCSGTVVDIVQLGNATDTYYHGTVHELLKYSSGATDNEALPLLSVYTSRVGGRSYDWRNTHRSEQLIDKLDCAWEPANGIRRHYEFLYSPVNIQRGDYACPTWARGEVLTDTGIQAGNVDRWGFDVGCRGPGNFTIMSERSLAKLLQLDEMSTQGAASSMTMLENYRQSHIQKGMYAKVIQLSQGGEGYVESAITAALVLGTSCLEGPRSQLKLYPPKAYSGVAAVYRGDADKVTQLLGKQGERWRSQVAALSYPGLEEFLPKKSYLHISKAGDTEVDLLSSARLALSNSISAFEAKLVGLTDSVDLLARHSSLYLRALGMEDERFSSHVKSLPKPPWWYTHNKFSTGVYKDLEPPEGSKLIDASGDLVILPDNPESLRVAALSLLPKAELRAAINTMSSMFLESLSDAKKDVELHANTINAKTEQGRILRDTLECIKAAKLKWYRKYPVAAYKDVFLALHKSVKIRATSSGSFVSGNTIRLEAEGEVYKQESVRALRDVFGVAPSCRVSEQGVRALAAAVLELMPTNEKGIVRDNLELLRGLKIYLSTNSEEYHEWVSSGMEGDRPEEFPCDILAASRMSLRAVPNSLYRHFCNRGGSPSVGVTQAAGCSKIELKFFAGISKGDRELELPFAGLLSIASWVMVDQDMGVEYAKAFREYALVLRNFRLGANYRMLEPALVEEATYADTLIEYLDRYLDKKS